MSVGYYTQYSKAYGHDVHISDLVTQNKYFIIFQDSGMWQSASTDEIDTDNGWDLGEFVSDSSIVSWMKKYGKKINIG